MPLGEGAGAGGSGGTGAPIGGGSAGGLGAPPIVPSQKLPNAIAGSAPAAPTAAAAAASAEAKSKIQAFSQGLGSGKKHGDTWKRKTNVNGSGATHVRSFHCKLNSESLEYMDQQINQWLDEHPDYEVKMVTSSIGEWTGKIKEPAVVVSVWV
jgi:hypothetical protein